MVMMVAAGEFSVCVWHVEYILLGKLYGIGFELCSQCTGYVTYSYSIQTKSFVHAIRSVCVHFMQSLKIVPHVCIKEKKGKEKLEMHTAYYLSRIQQHH